MGLTNSPLCRRYGAKDETSGHFLCECETLASLRHLHLGSFFLDPEEIKSLNLGAIWRFSEGKGLPWTVIRLWGMKGPFLNPRCIDTVTARTQLIINQSINNHHDNTKHSIPINLQHELLFYSQASSKCAPTIPICKSHLQSLLREENKSSFFNTLRLSQV